MKIQRIDHICFAVKDLEKTKQIYRDNFGLVPEVEYSAESEYIKVARYYIAEVPNTAVQLPPNPALGRPEHSDYRWVDRAEAWNLLTPRVRAILEWADSMIARPMRRR